MAEKTNRRRAIGKIFKSIGVLGVSGMAVGGVAKSQMESELTLRPPAAIDGKDFIKACLKCGNCVTACPYDTLKLAGMNSSSTNGTPYFEPRVKPCYLCTDAPCVKACPSGALDLDLISENQILDIEKSRMGVAVVDNKSCVAFWGIQCDACYRVCPLLDKAITLEYDHNERTGKHAFLKPVVHTDTCTGCGICEHACITEKASIMILPREAATGRSGDFYLKGWKEVEEERMKKRSKEAAEIGSDSKPEEYLNDWEDLIDD